MKNKDKYRDHEIITCLLEERLNKKYGDGYVERMCRLYNHDPDYQKYSKRWDKQRIKLVAKISQKYDLDYDEIDC